MTVPGLPSLLLLAYVFVFLPFLVLRSAARIRAARATADPAAVLPSRTSMWVGTLLMQCLALALALNAGRSFGYRPFALDPDAGTGHTLAVTSAALGVCFVLRGIADRLHDEGERRHMTVYLIAPRRAREWVLATVTVLVTAVSEEVVYRGVGTAIVAHAFGSLPVGVGLLALAFTVAHWTQGGKSMAVILAIALTMHALVIVTGSLVPAMIVHGVYDLVAGALIARKAREYDALRDAAAAS